MKNAYFRLLVNLAGPVEIGMYETPVNLVLIENKICQYNNKRKITR